AAVESRYELVLARDALPLRGVGDFQKKVFAVEFAVEWRHRDVDDAMLATERTGLHGQFALGECLARIDGPTHESAQRIGFEYQREKWLAARLVDAGGEQILGGHVGVDHAQVRIEHDDAGGQRPDEIGRLEMRYRGRKKVFNRHAGPRPC